MTTTENTAKMTTEGRKDVTKTPPSEADHAELVEYLTAYADDENKTAQARKRIRQAMLLISSAGEREAALTHRVKELEEEIEWRVRDWRHQAENNYRAWQATSAQNQQMRTALADLAVAEQDYRQKHDLYGDDDMRTGRAWDLLRRAGNAARSVLSALSLTEESR